MIWQTGSGVDSLVLSLDHRQYWMTKGNMKYSVVLKILELIDVILALHEKRMQGSCC